MASNRWCCGASTLGGRIYVAGGRYSPPTPGAAQRQMTIWSPRTLRSVECFDAATRVWSPVAPMGVARWGLGLATLGGKLYAAGGHEGAVEDQAGSGEEGEGYEGQRGQYEEAYGGGMQAMSGVWRSARQYGSDSPPKPKQPWGRLRLVECFDPMGCDVPELAGGDSQSGGREGGAGGSRSSSASSRASSSSSSTSSASSSSSTNMAAGHPERGRWCAVAPMNTARRGLGLASLHGKLYAVGGASGLGSRSDVEYLDPRTGQWVDDAPLNIARHSHGLAVLGGKLYAVGGVDCLTSKRLRSVECFDPFGTTERDSDDSDGDGDGNGSGGAGDRRAGAGGGGVGGSAAGGGRGTFHGSWTPVRPLSQARGNVAAVAMGGKLYAVGGTAQQGGRLRSVEVFDPTRGGCSGVWADVDALELPRSDCSLVVL